MSATCSSAGVVERTLPDGRVAVRVSRVEACSTCASQGACNAMGGQVKDHILVLDNPIGAQPGQWVRLHMPESSVMSASAVLYGIPAVALIAGAGAGVTAAAPLSVSADLGTALGAVVGLLVGLVVIYGLNRRLGARAAFRPRITGLF